MPQRSTGDAAAGSGRSPADRAAYLARMAYIGASKRVGADMDSLRRNESGTPLHRERAAALAESSADCAKKQRELEAALAKLDPIQAQAHRDYIGRQIRPEAVAEAAASDRQGRMF